MLVMLCRAKTVVDLPQASPPNHLVSQPLPHNSTPNRPPNFNTEPDPRQTSSPTPQIQQYKHRTVLILDSFNSFYTLSMVPHQAYIVPEVLYV